MEKLGFHKGETPPDTCDLKLPYWGESSVKPVKALESLKTKDTASGRRMRLSADQTKLEVDIPQGKSMFIYAIGIGSHVNSDLWQILKTYLPSITVQGFPAKFKIL